MSDEVIPVPIEARLDAYFAQHTAADWSQGLVYGIVGPDGLRHTQGFGVAKEGGPVPDADTVFPIASMTKSFIACAALIAQRHGLLSLQDPITAHVPEFTAADTDDGPYDPPTLGMLLSMSGGLTEDNSWIDPFIGAAEQTLLAQVSQGVRYSHAPGAVYEYSNLGYALTGIAIARATGMPIDRFVHEEILVPLGMTSTHFDHAAPADLTRATGYHLDTDGAWVSYPHATSDAFAAAGGIMSTIHDLAIWVTWLGSAFRPTHDDDVAILDRASRREMQRLHSLDLPAMTLAADGGLHTTVAGYGLGLRIDVDLHRGTIVSHGGGLPGFSLHMRWHPDSGHGVIALSNSHRGSTGDLCAETLGRLLAAEDAPAETIRPWPETVALRQEAERLIRDWDDTLAARIFADNIDFDRPLSQRRAQIEALVAQVGPLGDPRPVSDVVSCATPADVTWSIPGAHGELLCMIHLTPAEPAQIQEFVVQAVPAGQPRSAAPVDLSPRRTGTGPTSLGPLANVRVRLP